MVVELMLCIFVILVYSLLHNETFLKCLSYKNIYKSIFKVIYKYLFLKSDYYITVYLEEAGFKGNVRAVKEGLSTLWFNFVVIYSVFFTNFFYIYSSWCFLCFILATLYFFFNIWLLYAFEKPFLLGELMKLLDVVIGYVYEFLEDWYYLEVLFALVWIPLVWFLYMWYNTCKLMYNDPWEGIKSTFFRLLFFFSGLSLIIVLSVLWGHLKKNFKNSGIGFLKVSKSALHYYMVATILSFLKGTRVYYSSEGLLIYNPKAFKSFIKKTPLHLRNFDQQHLKKANNWKLFTATPVDSGGKAHGGAFTAGLCVDDGSSPKVKVVFTETRTPVYKSDGIKVPELSLGKKPQYLEPHACKHLDGDLYMINNKKYELLEDTSPHFEYRFKNFYKDFIIDKLWDWKLAGIPIYGKYSTISIKKPPEPEPDNDGDGPDFD